MSNLIMFVFSFAILSIVYRGWVLTMLWGWFLVPLGIPAISIATALGIVLIVSMFTPNNETKSEKKTGDISDQLAEAMGKAFATPTITLLIGLLVSLFV